MSGICGIAFREAAPHTKFASLNPMVRALDPLQKYQGHVRTGEVAGFGAQEFPGRFSGVAQLEEHGKTHLLGFHGSIYNFDDVLAQAGDCEDPLVAMLHIILRGAEPFLSSLRGEFALSFWDAGQETLYLASDRFRVHPIFYRQDQHQFVFSSRMKGLLVGPSSQHLTVNPFAIVDVVTSSFIPTPRTIFQEIQKLPPGQLLTWRHGAVQVKPYWELSFTNGQPSDKAELFRGVKESFSDSVFVRLQYDKTPNEMGTFLSGGIDSSTVLGVLTQLTGTSMKSFSIGFGEEAFNELKFARCAAQAFGAEQHEYIVTAEDTFQVIDLLVDSFDEPYANASAIPTYFCAKLAKEYGIKFMYGGDGGDELFAGNERYATQKIFDYYGIVPKWLRDWGIQPTVYVLAELLKLKVFLKGKKYIERANTPYPDRLLSWGLLEILPMEELFSQNFLESAGKQYDPHGHIRELYSRSKELAHTELERQLYLDLNLVISDNDLFKVTRMTEANGVAVRYPFLDYRLAEFAARVPAHIKMEGRQLRSFFKGAYADLLPLEIRTKQKQGFGLPIPIWLRTDKKLRELMMDLLLSETFQQRGYFPPEAIADLIKRHQQDSTSFFGTILWNFMMLELWLRRYCDNK